MSATPVVELAIDGLFEAAFPHTLLQANSLDKSALSKKSVDLIVTSPPYNVGEAGSEEEHGDLLDYQEYLEFTKQWLANCYHWTRRTGRLCVNVPLDKKKNGKVPLTSDVTQLALRCGWKYHATIIWDGGTISRRIAWGSHKSASVAHIITPVETIVVFYKDEWERARKGASDITAEEHKDWALGLWSFNAESAKQVGHEAPFPYELPKRCIKLFSRLGDTVLDPFAGSGTSMVAGIHLMRHAIGIEKEVHYCNLIRDRIQTQCGLQLEKKSLSENQRKSISECWMA